MSKPFIDLSTKIISLNRYFKRSLVIITDIGLCIISTWLAFVLRLDLLIVISEFNFYPALISVALALPIFWIFGMYRTIFRFTGSSFIFTILAATFVYGFLYFLTIGAYGIKLSPNNIGEFIPRSIGIIQPMLLFFGLIFSRLLVKFLLNYFYNQSFNNRLNIKKKVLIYGAGDAGRQLALSLENSLEFDVVGFLDDDYQLHRRVLLGYTIYSPSNLEKISKLNDVSFIFLALPSLNRNKRNQIIKKLNNHKNLIVKTLPSVSEIVKGKVTISDVKDLNVDDLLNRDQVEPDTLLLNKNINYKNVLVTGAGGSIGSELCRQIVKLKPNKILLLELNEFALYKTYEELRNVQTNVKIVPLLCNVQDQKKLEIIFDTFKVNTVYHAAAYKHVPLVEENICEGVKNNVYSTMSVVQASINKNVSNFVLISSDKAVRPTNLMGASKRLAELCVQGIHNKHEHIETNFSIVRFGNVLESSGSVIPKFRKQIRDGGPVTLTHREVTRYFMTITEAAQLVIQAGAMGKNSEVFLLDMGKSIKIKDLISRMINLSGLTIKDDKNPKGDIEIKIIGLRPGEKIHEELLIGDKPEETFHPKIKKTQEFFIPYEKLKLDLSNLKILLDENKAADVKELLNKILKFYNSSSEIVDHIHIEKMSTKDYDEIVSLNKNRFRGNLN